jgi:hypothetical protein
MCVCVSGNVLVYGLKSGGVVMRDMSDGGRLLPPVPARPGRIFALWLSCDQRGTLLVIGYQGFIESWARSPDRADDVGRVGEGDEVYRSWAKFVGRGSEVEEDVVQSTLWRLVHSWEHRGFNSKALGQSAVSAGTTAYSWGPDCPKGTTIIAQGGPCIVVWLPFPTAGGGANSKTPRGCVWGKGPPTVVARIPGEKMYSAVWLSPGCRLLVGSGGLDKIMVWELPDVQLVHVLQAAPRTCALWGTSTLLATASASDKLITLRSLETGAILVQYPQVVMQ